MSSSFCPHCGRNIAYRRTDSQPEAKSPLEGPPSPKGNYRWAGRAYMYDYGRIVPLLGLRPDPELAKVISCSRKRIEQFRRGLDIPGYHKLRGFEKLMGKIADVDIARRAGCHSLTVGKYRRKLGIPRCSRSAERADRKLKAYLDDLERFFKH